jgi:hypothetical protein
VYASGSKQLIDAIHGFFYSDKVLALVYASGSKQLISGSDDAILGIWNMDVKRVEVNKILIKDIKEDKSSHEKHLVFLWSFKVSLERSRPLRTDTKYVRKKILK